jgi:hypothetical protein
MFRILDKNTVKKSLSLWGRDLGVWLFFLFTFSCSRLPDVQGKGEAFLQGVWNQDSIAHKQELQAYTQHLFKFTCDSFYVDFVTHSKVNYYEEECYNGGLWKEYAKGTYQVRNDSLILVGDLPNPITNKRFLDVIEAGATLLTLKLKLGMPHNYSLKT